MKNNYQIAMISSLREKRRTSFCHFRDTKHEKQLLNCNDIIINRIKITVLMMS